VLRAQSNAVAEEGDHELSSEKHTGALIAGTTLIARSSLALATELVVAPPVS
jgi:hypothetical protein